MAAACRSLLAAALLLAAGCAPPTAPLYRDYERPAGIEDAELLDRLASGLESAGWEVVESEHPGVVATDERRMRDWGIYHLAVSLEAVPVGADHVRLFVHPFRRFFTGRQSKLFALDRGLRRGLFEPLDRDLAARGFKPIPHEEFR